MDDVYSLDPWALPRIPLAEKHRLPKTSGLYFVFQNNRLLYVGKTSTTFRSRWSFRTGHHREVQFTKIGDIEIACWTRPEKDADLHKLEKAALQVFNPSLNGTRIDKGTDDRFPISLPAWYYRKLCLWAKLRKVSVLDLIVETVQAQIEANWADIEKELEAVAKYKGKTLEELAQEWLADKKK